MSRMFGWIYKTNNIMPFNILHNIYKNNFNQFIESFRDCSLDSVSGTYVVSDLRNCFNFDKIRNSNYDINELKTTDSLYFSESSQRIAFVEFKNSRTKRKLGQIAKKAADSLFIHSDICNQNGFNIASICIHYFAVFSYSKNSALSSNTRFSVIASRSGKNSNTLQMFASELSRLFVSEMALKYSGIPNIISKFEVILSDSFSLRINEFDLGN